MSLPTKADAKQFLRIPVVVTAEDGLIDQLLSRAKGMVFGYLGRPVLRVARSYERLMPVWDDDRGEYVLRLGADAPIGGTIVVTDADGNTVASTDYTVDLRKGWLYAIPMLTWGRSPYTVTAQEGLEFHPDYATVIEPAISGALIDVVADLYFRRNPGTSSESGAGVSVSYGQSGMPLRTEETLKPWRRAPRV